MRISVSSSFIDRDALALVTGVYDAVRDGTIPAQLVCIISTREAGDNPGTDALLAQLRQHTEGTVPIICCSAKRLNRLGDASDEGKEAYDRYVLDTIASTVDVLPDVNMMLGDMIVRGRAWCDAFPSLNLHPDVPLSMGGTEGIYWEVIGEWVRARRDVIGGMIHLAVPALDAGTPIAYFQLPAKGTVRSVNLGLLWDALPTDGDARNALVREQVAKGPYFDDPLFLALREAEAYFEPRLVMMTLGAVANGDIQLRDGHVLDREGRYLFDGYDLTDTVVGREAIWPTLEGFTRKEGLR